MKRIIIDTNTLISYVTDRNPHQQEQAALLFESASRLKLSITLHLNVITEFVYVMDKIYDIDRNKISEIISDLLIMPGVNLVCEIDMKSVLAIWPSSISDYGDGLLAALCMRSKHSTIATFDKQFKKSLTTLSLPVYSF
jgi:predicted nucleic acid-binding protein